MESTSRPRPQLTDVVRPWEEQAQFALELLEGALEQLYAQKQSQPSFPEHEVEVSLCVSGLLRRLINQRGMGRLPHPSYDGTQARDLSHSGTQTYQLKRPDIHWMLADPQEEDEDRNHKVLDIECKRLGLPVSGRNLNRAYVLEGVLRFCRESHRYGAYSTWAVMIGYLQSSTLQTVWNEVNLHAQAAHLPTLIRLEADWQSVTSRLEHNFERPFPATPFRLLHLWIDLR